jgi:hypothetical protein
MIISNTATIELQDLRLLSEIHFVIAFHQRNLRATIGKIQFPGKNVPRIHDINKPKNLKYYLKKPDEPA